MRPDDRDLDEEIRGHLALSVKERVERGESPEAARLTELAWLDEVAHHTPAPLAIEHRIFRVLCG